MSELGYSNAEIKALTELRAGTETDELRAQGNLMVSASVILLPPILLFALGWDGLWIARGFRS